MLKKIAVLPTLLVLVGGVSWATWIWREEGGVPWEPLLVVIPAFSGLLIEIFSRSESGRGSSGHDRRILENLIAHLPSNGALMCMLRSDDLAGPIARNALDEMDRFLDCWPLAENNFKAKDLSIKLEDFCSDLGSFRSKLYTFVYPSQHNPNIYKMDICDFDPSPGLLMKREELNNQATQLFHKHQALIQAGKSMLYQN